MLHQIKNPKSKRNGLFVEILDEKWEIKSQGEIQHFYKVQFGDGVTVWTLAHWVGKIEDYKS